MSPGARLCAAVGLSLLLHGTMLAMIDRMPLGWRFGPTTGASWDGRLQARLRSPERGVEWLLPDAAGGAAQSQAPAQARENFGSPFAPADDDAARRRGPGTAGLPRYVPASELDEKPLILMRPEPEFPAGAAAEAGRVVLRLYIAETGYVDDIAVASVEPERAFEEPALRAFATARFTPGRKQGIAVKSMLTIEVLFGVPLPLAQGRLPEGPLFQPPSRGRLAPGATNRRVSQ